MTKSLMRSTKVRLVALITLALILLTSCSEVANVDTEGNAIRYTWQEVEEGNMQGVFVMHEDKTFSPLLYNLPGYAGSTTQYSPKRFVWFTDNTENITGAMPIATPNDPLVIIYNSNQAMPSTWYLEGYKDKGYTLGAHFYISQDKDMYLQLRESLSNTSASAAITNLNAQDTEYQIVKVNGKTSLPLNNVDPNINMLLGLQSGKVYTFDFYKGTKATPLSAYADTRVFQSSSFVQLQSALTKTENGYFIINLPINMKTGYYYLNDIGFFKYEAN